MSLTRLFRAHTPSDTACATIVANSLPPGRNVLAVCADKACVQSDGYLACMLAVARAHDWSAVVDLSGVPLNRVLPAEASVGNRWRRMQETLGSLAMMRQLLAPAFGLAAGPGLAGALDARVDELFFACLYHLDIQALSKLFPRARKVYYPHTFDSCTEDEAEAYVPWCEPANGRPAALTLTDRVKRLFFGEDAVPLRRVRVNAACTFNKPVPWAPEQFHLGGEVNRFRMAAFFQKLPAEVRHYYEGLAACCGRATGGTGLLLLSPEVWFLSKGLQHEHVRLARHLLDNGAEALLVKPHPRSDTAWVQDIVRQLRQELPSCNVTVIDEFYYYPVEIVLTPFRLVACAALMSTCLATLGAIYRLPAFCPVSVLQRAFPDDSEESRSVRRWIAEYSERYIAF